jgi:hypothetical protein
MDRKANQGRQKMNKQTIFMIGRFPGQHTFSTLRFTTEQGFSDRILSKVKSGQTFVFKVGDVKHTFEGNEVFLHLMNDEDF